MYYCTPYERIGLGHVQDMCHEPMVTFMGMPKAIELVQPLIS